MPPRIQGSEQTDPEDRLSHYTSGDASITVLGEGDALDQADSGRIFPELLEEHFFLVYLDPTPH